MLKCCMLDSCRKLGKRTLCRWPRLYGSSRRALARLTYWLGIPHDADFSFFRNLQNIEGLFVDIGANSGQSARSLRMFNRSLDILSFEPNRLLEPELRATGELLGPGFDYRMHGLGARQQIVTLYFPVACETLLSPWATADREALEHNRPAIEREAGTAITIATVPVEIRRFDDLDLHPLVVKIDVEGFEVEVLEGMRETLARDEPILLIESSPNTPAAVELLESLGYSMFTYNGPTNSLTETLRPVGTNNYFALTPKSIEQLAGTQLSIVRRQPHDEPLAV